jgi:hypothetical protein
MTNPEPRDKLLEQLLPVVRQAGALIMEIYATDLRQAQFRQPALCGLGFHRIVRMAIPSVPPHSFRCGSHARLPITSPRTSANPHGSPLQRRTPSNSRSPSPGAGTRASTPLPEAVNWPVRPVMFTW